MFRPWDRHIAPLGLNELLNRWFLRFTHHVSGYQQLQTSTIGSYIGLTHLNAQGFVVREFIGRIGAGMPLPHAPQSLGSVPRIPMKLGDSKQQDTISNLGLPDKSGLRNGQLQ